MFVRGGVVLLPYANAITTVAHHRPLTLSLSLFLLHTLFLCVAHSLTRCAHTHTHTFHCSLDRLLPPPQSSHCIRTDRLHLGTAPVQSPALSSSPAAALTSICYAPARAQSAHSEWDND